ncbi:hypothetical protein PV328_011914 [Microctonus aethiopoides]|uniref:Uncharacterized protein n=1 Tax=Microctonus aethiopoides TaxID=144406 RepID=A0AA39C369_9HYME|nr:hypothetical protein PV328_011914 [Microctonus aethiopoides]
MTTSGILDKFIVSFLAAALVNDRRKNQVNESLSIYNQSIGSEVINFEVKLNESDDKNIKNKPKDLYERKYSNLYEYGRHFKAKRHRRKFTRQENNFKLRKIFSILNNNEDFNIKSVLNLEAKSCLQAEYIIFTWILCLIALASALKLYYLVKCALASIIVFMYAALVMIGCQELFQTADENETNFLMGVASKTKSDEIDDNVATYSIVSVIGLGLSIDE